MGDVLFERLCIIGPGLIGGSIARMARARGDVARHIVTTAKSQASRDRVRELGFADTVAETLAEAVQGADCVVLCVPVGVYAKVMEEIGPHLAPGCILTDAGSTKSSVVRDVRPHLGPGVRFVPAHPMAGTEHSGPDAGFPELFQGRYCIITPLEDTDPGALGKVRAMWERAGSMIETMDPATHDKVVAMVSHLPHLIAFTICSTADDLAEETREAVLKFAASGFRDFTRIAASDIDMWRDIFLNNREALLEMLARFSEDAHALGRAVRYGQAEFIEDRLARGRKIRRGLIERKQA
ncbi:prephenate/arogenate dehydrogenase family protein [Rhodovarius crocodyli]|uniref:prephenate dehydrogenase n=1 Tax=Rhodovarius crocodyli TaxID=1979269 RepID=A0A437M2L6_9PROT|nr:prephenate/arogenate dehydrogenase family protein [Rhodovarius crocodyli]RVT91960.1 prephenate/arogenate dehydrogenase family protein [Rhodovarius crocodyli]